MVASDVFSVALIFQQVISEFLSQVEAHGYLFLNSLRAFMSVPEYAHPGQLSFVVQVFFSNQLTAF